MRERWIAAWYYLANRYPEEDWKTNPVLRSELFQLANNVQAFATRRDDSDPRLRALHESLDDVIDRLAPDAASVIAQGASP